MGCVGAFRRRAHAGPVDSLVPSGSGSGRILRSLGALRRDASRRLSDPDRGGAASALTLQPVVIRATSLYLPIAITWGLWLWRRPEPRAQAACLLASVWNLSTLLLVNTLAQEEGWWTFEGTGGLLGGVPIDLYLGWNLLWGAIPALAFPRGPLFPVAALMLWIDVLFMPRLAPVVQLGPNWLAGEFLGLLLVLAPAQLLARWTAEDHRLRERVALQVVAFCGLSLYVLPQVILEQWGKDWRPLFERPAWLTCIYLQIAFIPAVLGLAAVQEFCERGQGTPVPYDPPRRLVTTGPYAYVANPMQISCASVLAAWGLLLENAWVAAAGALAYVFGVGLARWDEGRDLEARFGAAWKSYRKEVRNWWPRLRPWHVSLSGAPSARLYIAESCLPCSAVERWFSRRAPRGVEIVAAERHPSRDLSRITYDPADRSPAEEGVRALARGLEHIHLGYALVGWTVRLPLVRPFLQLLLDASGGGPRQVKRACDSASAPVDPDDAN